MWDSKLTDALLAKMGQYAKELAMDTYGVEQVEKLVFIVGAITIGLELELIPRDLSGKYYEARHGLIKRHASELVKETLLETLNPTGPDGEPSKTATSVFEFTFGEPPGFSGKEEE